ncbi:MAG: aspartate aminotransferase family protein [Actinomycetota bacterium]|nr:MAG: aspartate aminotransferase family protein [Actinomycetota bacterium]
MVELNNSAVFSWGSEYIMPTYSRLPVVFLKGSMQYLWDIENNKYIDYIAGYGCLNVGHSNKYIVKAVKRQVEKLIQPSNVYFNLPQVELAEKLCKLTGFGSKVFFANSGSESIESAIKLARKYSTDKYGNKRYGVITFGRSFHGRTMGALSATAQPKKQRAFEPLLEGFKYAEFNNMDSVRELIDENTCAIMLEPVQGEGGVYPADKGFMKDLKDICIKNDILLILDEVQTGFGRTGKMFAYENYNIVPDILVVAKSLGGGMPIGAIISTNNISKSFTPGVHGSTFGGNAASCAAGLAVIDYILDNELSRKAKELGNYFISRLQRLEKKYSVISEVRGTGLMVGLEFSEPVAARLVSEALEDGLVINKVSDHTLRFLPPLVIKKSHLDKLIKWLDHKIKDI